MAVGSCGARARSRPPDALLLKWFAMYDLYSADVRWLTSSTHSCRRVWCDRGCSRGSAREGHMTPVEFMVFDLDNDITAGRREAERPPCSASGFEGRPVEPPVRNCDAANRERNKVERLRKKTAGD